MLGTLTGRLGDPTGRDETRPILSDLQAQQNASGLLAQCRRVLMPGFSVHLNHTFAETLTVTDFLVRLAGRFTVASLLARDGFRARMSEGKPIAGHELLVPLLQGFDSVVLRTELEVGGTDQLFNFQIARALQRAEEIPAEDVLMGPIVRGTDGRKMSKSLGNTIWLDEPPESMFEQILAAPDDVADEWASALTDLPLQPQARHPLQRKKALASDIVSLLHGGESARWAADRFERLAQRKEIPEDLPSFSPSDLVTLVAGARGESRSKARRLIEGGGVRIAGQRVVDPSHETCSGDRVQIGRLWVAIV